MSTGRLRLIFGSEENARLVLLAALLAVYLLSGALLFRWLEADEEDRAQQAFEESKRRFLEAAGARRSSNDTDTFDEHISLEELLDGLLRANSEGVFNVDNRPRWDLAGSLYFVATVVSTIGYGMTTPRTLAGKMVLVAYGLPGCSGAILFFNLFLERIITLLASVMRYVHEAELRRRGFGAKTSASSRSNNGGDDDDYDEDGGRSSSGGGSGGRGTGFYGTDLWKPSVHWVMFYMAVFSGSIVGVGALLYSRMEGWTYLEALYFCFVSYATIGFGDYVPSRRTTAYHGGVVYHVASFAVLLLGCCCVYSLFNVASIVLKGTLNAILVRLDRASSSSSSSCTPANCCRSLRRADHVISKDAQLKMRSRRNAIVSASNHVQVNAATKRSAGAGAAEVATSTSIDMDSNYDSDSDDEDEDADDAVIDVDGDLPVFEQLVRLKVSLAVMQKQLYEAAQLNRARGERRGGGGGGRVMGRRSAAAGVLWPAPKSSTLASRMRTSAFLPAAVGPLAIVTSKLQGSDDNT